MDIRGSGRVLRWTKRLREKDVEDFCVWVFVSEMPGPIGFRYHSSVSLTGRNNRSREKIYEH